MTLLNLKNDTMMPKDDIKAQSCMSGPLGLRSVEYPLQSILRNQIIPIFKGAKRYQTLDRLIFDLYRVGTDFCQLFRLAPLQTLDTLESLFSTLRNHKNKFTGETLK